MRKVLFVLVLLPAFLIGCKKSSAPSGTASAPADAVQNKLQELAGSGATDCGRYKSQAPDQMKIASDCASKAAQSKHAFYVAYDLPGLIVGVAGNGEGKLFALQAQQSDQAGSNAQVQTAPCPADLRIAQSGRVTCAPPGSMGMNVGGSSPHGGEMAMPSVGAQSAHGGMSTTPGTPNPHAGGKTPPKQK